MFCPHMWSYEINWKHMCGIPLRIIFFYCANLCHFYLFSSKAPDQSCRADVCFVAPHVDLISLGSLCPTCGCASILLCPLASMGKDGIHSSEVGGRKSVFLMLLTLHISILQARHMIFCRLLVGRSREHVFKEAAGQWGFIILMVAWCDFPKSLSLFPKPVSVAREGNWCPFRPIQTYMYV